MNPKCTQVAHNISDYFIWTVNQEEHTENILDQNQFDEYGNQIMMQEDMGVMLLLDKT